MKTKTKPFDKNLLLELIENKILDFASLSEEVGYPIDGVFWKAAEQEVFSSNGPQADKPSMRSMQLEELRLLKLCIGSGCISVCFLA